MPPRAQLVVLHLVLLHCPTFVEIYSVQRTSVCYKILSTTFGAQLVLYIFLRSLLVDSELWDYDQNQQPIKESGADGG